MPRSGASTKSSAISCVIWFSFVNNSSIVLLLANSVSELIPPDKLRKTLKKRDLCFEKAVLLAKIKVCLQQIHVSISYGRM